MDDDQDSDTCNIVCILFEPSIKNKDCFQTQIYLPIPSKQVVHSRSTRVYIKPRYANQVSVAFHHSDLMSIRLLTDDSAVFGTVIERTPSFKLASIPSRSTLSGNRNDRLNSPTERSEHHQDWSGSSDVDSRSERPLMVRTLSSLSSISMSFLSTPGSSPSRR